MGFDRPGITPSRPKKKKAVAGVGGSGRAGVGAEASSDRKSLSAQVDRAVVKARAGRGPRVDSGTIRPARSRTVTKADVDLASRNQRRGRGAVKVDSGTVVAPPPKDDLRSLFSSGHVSLGRALADELEGRGVIGHAVDAAARAVVDNSRLSAPPTYVPGAGVVSGASTTHSGVAAALGAYRVKDSPLVANTVKDAARFPVDAVASLYNIAAAVKEAGQGNTKRGKKLIGGLDDGPLGRLVLHADPKGAAKAAEDHPLFSALELSGTGQVLGRGAGAIARSGALGHGAKRAAGTARAPLQIAGGVGRQTVERRYSPNLIVKGGQVAAERSQRKRGLDPNVARGKTRERALNAAVDEFAAQAEGTRRRGREETAKSAARLAPVRHGVGATSRAGRAAAAVDRARSRGLEASSLPGARGHAERHVVLAAVEGRLRGPKTFVQDVAKERERLQAVYVAERAGMSAPARRANREQVKALDRVLADPKARASAGEVFRAADEYNAHANSIERELIHQGALDPVQAAHARVRTYAVAHMGLKPNRDGTGLLDANGRKVGLPEIQQHIVDNGNREPGFVGHRRDERGAASYFVNWYGGRKTVDSKRRTGEAARTGGYDASFGALEQQLVRGRGVTDAIRTFDDFAGRFGTTRRDGSHFTWPEAERSAGELGESTGMQWLPVRVVPARYDAATKQAILDAQGTAALPHHLQALTLGRIDDALKAPVGRERLARNVVLVPAQQLKRFAAHQTSGSSTAGKAGQAATKVFRGTVLPFSTKWLAGNVAEAVLRSAAHGITPVDVVRGARVMRSLRGLDEQAWKAADTRIRGGLLYGAGDKLNVRRGAEDVEGTVLHTPAVAIGQVARLPVVRQILGGLKVYQRAVFAANRGIERAFQTGVIGKAARKDAQELTGSWAKAIAMQHDVAQEVARGLLGTPKQEQFARYADEVLGKYSRFSPGTRRVIQTFAPFLPWFLNAARFVGYTLPVRHPAKTALLANVELTLHDDIEAHGKTVPPGDLQSAIATKDGGQLNLARFTPFGAFTSGAEGLVAPLLPQIDSAVKALQGQAFTGKPLQLQAGGPASDSKRLWLAMYTLLEGAVPGVQIARRIREGGATAFDDSTVVNPKVKPGTAHGGAANRILNPLRPTYLGGGSTAAPPSSAAQAREAQAIAREQSGAAAAKQQAALEREARAILREQQGP